MALVLHETLMDGVSVVKFNDPDNMNAMSEAMADEFAALMRQLTGQNGLRALVLTGAGRAFSAGGDLNMLERKTQLSPEENRRLMLKFYNSFLCALDLGVPLVAAVNGHAIGAGLCVACACDVRIASEKAKLGFTFARLGLHPGMGATYFLPRVIGLAAATELMITGRVVEANEALGIGLVSKVVPAEQILDEARRVVSEILECGPQAVAQILESMRGQRSELVAALEREAQCQSINYAGPEFKEGVRSTIEKRKPSWSRG